MIAAFFNAYIIGLGTDVEPFPDALGFQQDGVKSSDRSGDWYFSFINKHSLVEYPLGAMFYEQVLGAVYSWFSPSHLLGGQLSILVFALSCIIFLKIMQQFGSGAL